MAPLAFQGFLVNYLGMIRQLALNNWKSDMMVKCCLLMLYYPLKQYSYYTPPQLVVQTGKDQKKHNSEWQQICYQNFYAYFTQPVLSELLNHLLTVVMTRERPEDNAHNVQLLIDEDDVNTGIDEIISELDCTIKKLSMAIIEQMLYRFTNICLDLVNDLASNLVQGNLNGLSFQIQENIVYILGILPK